LAEQEDEDESHEHDHQQQCVDARARRRGGDDGPRQPVAPGLDHFLPEQWTVHLYGRLPTRFMSCA
jgi:hypothetical protein